MKNYWIIAAAVLCLNFPAPSAMAGDYVNTRIQKTVDYYVWITALSVGEKIRTNISEMNQEKLGKKAIDARQFRVAVTTSEIYNSVYLEEITHGPEGCCLKFAKIRKLDLHDMQKKFKLQGELSGFEVSYWTSPTSFKFKIHNRTFELSDLDKTKVYIEEETKAP